MKEKPDLDFETIDGIDDQDDYSLLLLIRDRNTDKYGWHWIERETLAEHGLKGLAQHGFINEDEEEICG